MSVSEMVAQTPTGSISLDGKLKKMNHSLSLSALSTEATFSPPVSPVAGKPRQIKVSTTPRESQPSWDLATIEAIKRAKGYGTHLESLAHQALELKLDPQSETSLQAHIKARMAARSAYVRGLHSKCRDVELVLIELRDSAAMLKRAIWSKWAPLCVVQERIRIRSTKSPQEQRQDGWQLALETEEATLIKSREKLMELVKETKHWISVLSQARDGMHNDLNRKRRVGKIDHTVLLEGYHKGIHLAEECNFLPLKEALETVLRPENAASDDVNEETELASVRKTFEVVENYISCARAQMKENRSISLEKGRLCSAAKAVSITNMHADIGVLNSSVKQLRDLILECEKHICRGKLAMDVASNRLNRSADPVRRISRQYSARVKHPDQVHLPSDRVYDKMDEHLTAVKTFINSISSHMECTKEVMEELKVTKLTLQQVLNNKQNALSIDVSCVKEKREWIKTSALLEGGEFQ